MRSLLLVSAITVSTAASGVAALVGPAQPAAEASAARPADGQSFKVDLSHSNVLFKIRHLGVATQWGRFDKFEGRFVLDAEGDTSSVEMTLEADSVNTNDEKRDAHLRNEDFFNVKQFPTMTFRSTKVVPGDDGVFAVTGDLTLHGETKTVTFDAKKVGEATLGGQFGHRCGFEGELVIDRNDFGIKTYPDLLGAEVTMIIALEGILQD